MLQDMLRLKHHPYHLLRFFVLVLLQCIPVFQDLERTAERGRNETLRPGCTAAFSVPGAIEGGGELLVITAELREAQVLWFFGPG